MCRRLEPQPQRPQVEEPGELPDHPEREILIIRQADFQYPARLRIYIQQEWWRIARLRLISIQLNENNDYELIFDL